MYEPSQPFALWLAAVLQAYSGVVWDIVPRLAGGPQGPPWRWALVELALFGGLLFVGAWWVRMLIGVGRYARAPQHWGTAAVFACGFSLLWNWYGLVASQMMQIGLHPTEGWEWTFLTWGLPFMVAGAAFSGAPFLGKLGVALALGTVALLALGRWWAGGRGLPRRRRAT